MPALARLLPLALLGLVHGQQLWSADASAAAGLLGSPKYMPSPDRPVGWRGDGTGRYPGATPPTAWGRKHAGSGYETKNILWATPLPNGGVSCPIIVGN